MYNRAFRQVFYLSPKHGNPSPLEGFPMCQSRVLVVLVAPKVQTAPATNEMGPYQLSIIMYSRYNICIILSDRDIYIYIYIYTVNYYHILCYHVFPCSQIISLFAGKLVRAFNSHRKSLLSSC